MLELGAGTTDINLLAAARELIGIGEIAIPRDAG
jgi:hypothetical protein